jgi:hypothetical protein
VLMDFWCASRAPGMKDRHESYSVYAFGHA